MGAPLPGEIDGGVGEHIADALAAETRAGDEAGHGPDTVVGLVLGSARPGDSTKTHIGGARLDRAPAGGLAVEVGYEAARRARLGVTTARVLAQPGGTLLDGSRRLLGVPLPPAGLEALALASGRRAPRANTASRSSQLASLAGTIVTLGVVTVSVMRTQSCWLGAQLSPAPCRALPTRRSSRAVTRSSAPGESPLPPTRPASCASRCAQVEHLRYAV